MKNEVIVAVLREQHREILETMSALQGLLEGSGAHPEEVAERAVSLLAKLAEQAAPHLEQERALLYAWMLREDLQHEYWTFDRFQSAYGDLPADFSAYAARWRSVHSIVAGFEAFVLETGELFQILAGRIGTEETDLFPLYEHGALFTHLKRI